jgi:hypothetical protein
MMYEGRSRRSGTVRRRRASRSSAAEKTRYMVFLETFSRTHYLLRTGDSIHVFYQPLPCRYPVIDMLTQVVCLGLS